MRKSAILNVSVEDSRCKPVRGVRVILTPENSKRGKRLKPYAPGQYQIRDVAPGSYVLNISKPAFESEESEIRIDSGMNSVLASMGRAGDIYFYALGRKVYGEAVKDHFILNVKGKNAVRRTASELERSQLESVSAPKRLPGTLVEDADSCFQCIALPEESKTAEGADRTIKKLTNRLKKLGLEVTPALILKRGESTFGLTNRVFAKFEDGVSKEKVKNIGREFGLKVERAVSTGGNAFVLSRPGPLSFEILEDINRLHHHPLVICAEPDLLAEIEADQYTPNDLLYNLQTHLPLIRADAAWESMGDMYGDHRGGRPDTCIAVFDPFGVAPNHPDLTANLSDGNSKLITSFDFANMATQTVGTLGGDHGTQCSGVCTAAFDNSFGVAGVAPNCRLIGAKIPSAATGLDMAEAFLWSAGINPNSTTPNFPNLPAQACDVISNSWGASYAALSTPLRDAFDRLTDEGRSGKGVVVTFSTGNLGYVPFSTVRTFAAYNRTVAVGASINTNPTSPVNSVFVDPITGTNNNVPVAVDTRALYSPYGPELDIVAPSHTCYPQAGGPVIDPTTTTVLVGNGALDGCPGIPVCFDYAASFGGTSHASPTIAGAAAMVISANPLLHWWEVRDVMRNTAIRIDAGQTNAIGLYVDNDGDGLAEFSQWYGYGRVDVGAAVEEALILHLTQSYLLH